MKTKTLILFLSATLVILFLAYFLFVKDKGETTEYYRIETIPIPEDIVLEVGGLAFTDKDQLGISTRHGEVWILENPYLKVSEPDEEKVSELAEEKVSELVEEKVSELAEDEKPVFRKYASGLHEALGLAWYDHGFILSQRGELTKLEDTDGDGSADRYRAIYSWPLSGNYHEYSYGPVFTQDGNMLVTLNLSWIGRGESLTKWRGWLLKITPEGEMTPMATGLRSPAGLGVDLDGDIFYTENQGDWVGSGRMTHLRKGDFAGNPAGLKWSGEENSPVALKREDIPNTGLPMHEIAADVPGLRLPAIDRKSVV